MRSERSRERDTRIAKGLALALGFDRVGIAPATAPLHGSRFTAWLARGFAGEMHYLGRRAAERLDPAQVVPGAKSILCVALRYAERRVEGPVDTDAPDRGPAEPSRSVGRVARYAAGVDYHDVMQRRLRSFGSALEALADRPLQWRSYVDTGPVLEREAAARAGLGWIGKNTCLIDPKIGSYFFIGVLLSDFDFCFDDTQPDRCGSCRACLDVCPTDALREPHLLDATRCLAYTTIELRTRIPTPLRAPQDQWVFGCDLCQEVCPWNRPSGRGEEALSPLADAFQTQEAWRRPALAWLLSLDEDAWRQATRKSALRRSKHRGLLRNALVAAGNSGDPTLIPQVETLCEASDPLIAEHAAWALARLRGGPAAASEAR